VKKAFPHRTEKVELVDQFLIKYVRGCRIHWKDFELLVELIVTQGGYRRVTETGGTQKTTDIELVLPLTGERLFVQAKARLNQSTADEIIPDLLRMADGGRILHWRLAGPVSHRHCWQFGLV
jgi:hypothetical protein